MSTHITLWAFDLDDFSAMVRKNLCAQRADHHRCEIDHLDAGKQTALAFRFFVG
jgi:hypothetical protein